MIVCKKQLTHLSLFSGIGGLDLAAEWAGFKTVGQCECGDFQTKILQKHWPNVERWGDIRELNSDVFFRRTGIERPTVISGGFPCQPHSVAGKRKASGDERDLWPEMRRVIGDIRPRWVVAENVPGLLSSENGRFFGRVLRDFSEMGYDVGWGTTSVFGAGGIHKRERISIVAHAGGLRLQGRVFEEKQEEADEQFERICVHLLRSATKKYLSESSFLREFNGVPDRVDRTIALGNSVCPQSFYPFFRYIAMAEQWGGVVDE